MARTKKTIVQEFKELIDATPKAHILTKEQLEILKDVSRDLLNIRSTLEDLEGNEDLSTIMFRVGQSAYMANKAEDQLDEIINSYNEEDCEDCDDDF